MTGHLRSPDRILFTLGIREAGSLYLRNDTTGNSAHLPATAHTSPAVTGQTAADLTGHVH
ncbi:hypothetical protein [Streptomyces sp. NPDC093094]|uniref:hypothetical protein n=1 Tax=Streptomyces sp. NPDC093094 TaxID=3366026 RepID=UPI003800DC39